MSDQRKQVLRALGGNISLEPLSDLADTLVLEALPRGLNVQQAAERLLTALRERDEAAFVRVLRKAAGLVNLHVRRVPEAQPSHKKVGRILAEADQTLAELRDWVETVERRPDALVVRSTDPGTLSKEGRCDMCRTPRVLAAAVAARERNGLAWALVLAPEGE